jgi:hypothetical protein
MDHGLKVRRPALRPVVSYDRNYYLSDRDGYEITEIVPRRGEKRAEGGDQLSDGRDGYKIIEVASRRRGAKMYHR